jgi:hypothetical protein
MGVPEFVMPNLKPNKASGKIRFVYVSIISYCVFVL